MRRSPPKGTSGRALRTAEAAAAKEAAARLGKNAWIDVRYRRIAGNKPAIWPREDVDYDAGLVSAKGEAGESPPASL